MMARILILGGAGFVGSYTVAELVALGHEVTVYDLCRRSSATTDRLWRLQSERIATVASMACLERGDVRDIDSVRRMVAAAKPELVLFLPSLLAGESKANPHDALAIHVGGLENVLEALSACSGFQRLVYVSSSFVYGHARADVVDEEHPRAPLDVYGRTKLIGEELTTVACSAVGREFVIVRPAAVYGYGDTLNRSLDRMMAQALASKPVEVIDPSNRADFTAVTDLAVGLVLALTCEAAAGGTFNITRGEGRTNLEVASLIAKSIPGAVLDVWDEGDQPAPRRATMSVARARERLGFSPRISVEEGIPLLLAHHTSGDLAAVLRERLGLAC